MFRTAFHSSPKRRSRPSLPFKERYLLRTLHILANLKGTERNSVRIDFHLKCIQKSLGTPWKARNIRMKVKLNLMKASVLLHGCESWRTTDQRSAKKLQALETKTYRRFLGITWKQKKTNGFVWEKLVEANDGVEPERLTTTMKKEETEVLWP